MAMAASLPPRPEIFIEPAYCPQAVIDWYVLSASTEHRHNTELSLKAKKHLIAIGWEFWYYNKKTRWELRYKSPNGRNYISLRTACKSCMDDGGCALQHHQTLQPPPPPPLPPPPPQEPQTILDEPCPLSTSPVVSLSSLQQEHPPPLKNSRKICKKPSAKPRRGKKRKGDYLDEEWTPTSSTSSASKNGKVPRSCRSSDSSYRNPRTVLSWLIDNKVVLPEAKVRCLGGKNVLKSGKLLRSGVSCDCCGLVFTLTRFEAHAGCNKHRPSETILLEDGRSLMDCQREALSNSQLNMHVNGNGFLEDQNDSICSVCLYGGELLLCDRCPSSFHPGCVGLDHVPDGDWFCPPCCCKICNCPRFREDCKDHADNNLIACDQCELKYHIGCLRSRGFNKFKNNPSEIWLCSGSCENIFLGLKMMIGSPIRVDGGDNLTWTLLKSTKSSAKRGGDHDELGGLSQIQSKLSVALGVMHECFEPIHDTLSGRDIVADVIFSRGSRLNRLNFKGFYTVVLERNDEIISVANVRVFGERVAEVPLVATREQFRRHGMCRILMDVLVKLLAQLGVEKMVLPAANYLIGTWTKSFGFAKMTASDKFQYLDYTFLDFQEATMCHKSLKEAQKLRI